MSTGGGEWRGIARAWAKAWPAIVLLATGELVLAVVAALPANLAVAQALGQRPMLVDLANGNWLSVQEELLNAGAAAQGAATPSARVGMAVVAVGTTALIAVVAAIVHVVLYSFAAGAALSVMMEGRASAWRAGARWFWPMLRLGVLLIPIAVVLGGLGTVGLIRGPGAGAAGPVLKTVAWLVWLGAIGCVFELARAGMVARGSRSAIGGIWHALRLLAARPARVAGTWLLLAAGDLLVLAIVLGLSFLISATMAVPAVLVTAFALIAAPGYKICRLAAQARLAIGGCDSSAAGLVDE